MLWRSIEGIFEGEDIVGSTIEQFKFWVGALEDRSPQEDQVGACTSERVGVLEVGASRRKGWSLGKIRLEPWRLEPREVHVVSWQSTGWILVILILESSSRVGNLIYYCT